VRRSRRRGCHLGVSCPRHRPPIPTVTNTLLIPRANGSTTPVATWMLIHILSSPDLLSALREEIGSAISPHPTASLPTFDIQALTSLPLLQSVYTETLRLHVSVNITREVVKPLDIAGYTLPSGSIIQAPTAVAHFDEGVWGVEGHPASEFYAERHVKTVKGKRVFECVGKGSDLFPFGESFPTCMVEYVADDNRRRRIHVSRKALCKAGDSTHGCDAD
jgi:cytochrome P450